MVEKEGVIIRDYAIKRILQGILLVFAVSFLVFALMYMMPGNPIDIVTDSKVSPEKKAEIAHELGYDLPFLVQYKNWLVNAVHLDFGNSLRYKNPVWDMMAARIPYSSHRTYMCGQEGQLLRPFHCELLTAFIIYPLILAWRTCHSAFCGQA